MSEYTKRVIPAYLWALLGLATCGGVWVVHADLYGVPAAFGTGLFIGLITVLGMVHLAFHLGSIGYRQP